MHILFPAYTVQHRTLEWTGIETSSSHSGDSKLEREVREKNESFRTALFKKVLGYVDELADGEITVTRSFVQYLPKSRTNYRPD